MGEAHERKTLFREKYHRLTSSLCDSSVRKAMTKELKVEKPVKMFIDNSVLLHLVVVRAFDEFVVFKRICSQITIH